MVHVNETIVIKSSSPKLAEWVKKLKAQKLLAQGAWSKLAYILSIEALSTVQVARFTISVFAVLLLS